MYSTGNSGNEKKQENHEFTQGNLWNETDAESHENPQNTDNGAFYLDFRKEKPSEEGYQTIQKPVKEEIRYIEKPTPKISEIRIFYDNTQKSYSCTLALHTRECVSREWEKVVLYKQTFEY